MNRNLLLQCLLLLTLTIGKTSTVLGHLPSSLKDGLKTYLDEKDSSKFIKFNMVAQLWSRYAEFNPNTNVTGVHQTNATDFSIRRIRFIMSGQLTDRLAFFVQFGQNNLNYLSARKASSFFHDVTVDYAFVKKHLSVGMGLNGWNGPSRFSNISVSSIAVLDPPSYQEVTNDTYDQFVRRLGIYAKGKFGRFDYRLSAAKPFTIKTATGIDPITTNTNSTFSTLPPNLVYQGYLMYQFLDQESNFAPAMTGTYLGKKRVLNLGVGFYTQKNAMFHINPSNASDTIKQNILLLAADLFYDAPINIKKGTAISAYVCYSKYDFGTNFLKVNGANNSADGSSLSKTNFDKANYGTAFPYLGSGNILYTQVAYKLKSDLLGDRGTLQPFGNIQYSQYSKLNDPMYVFDLGVNWLLIGHNTKVTLDYQNRPYFTENAAGNLKETSRRNMVVVQLQLAF